MKLLKHLLAWVITLASLAAIGAGIYYGFQYVTGFFAGLGPQVKDTTLAILAAVVIGALVIVASIRWVVKRKAKEQSRFEKAQVYQQCLEVMAARLRNGKAQNGAMAQAEAAERALLVWGSNSVVKKYSACKAVAEQEQESPAAVQGAVEKLLKTIRTDLGQSAFGLTDGEMSGLWLSTINSRPVPTAK